MSTCRVAKRLCISVSQCLAFFLSSPSYGNVTPSQRLYSDETQPPAAASRPAVQTNSKKPAKDRKKQPHGKTGGTRYTIKAGDNLFTILMREYGLTARQAGKFIDVVRRENNISDVRKLKVGQRITITALIRKYSAGSMKAGRTVENVTASSSSSVNQGSLSGQVLALEKPEIPLPTSADVTDSVKRTWEKIVPGQNNGPAEESIQSDGISVSLDPAQYPILPAMDGGRILVDAKGKIPEELKKVLSEKDPNLRIVSKFGEEPKKLLAALIASGKFYSSAEDFVMEFGSDPKLTVRSDFRVERTADSVVNQDVILMNSGKVALSSTLTEFLKKEGFTVHEPFALIKPHEYLPRNRLVRVGAQSPLEIANSLLEALSISAEKNARIGLVNIDSSGVSLSISPDFYFRYKGKSYCISFDTDNLAQNSSLTPLLEARGIHPIVLGKNDNFREISEKILSGIGISATYGFQGVWPEEDAGYALEMSGILIDGAGEDGGSLFLTDREIDRIIRDISAENGFVMKK